MKLSEHERVVELRPVGIQYICEVCHDGEMIVDTREPIVVEFGYQRTQMRPHYCNKCGAQMQLPKSYPYIEWITEEEYEELMGKNKVEVDNGSTEVHMDDEAERSLRQDYAGL